MALQLDTIRATADRIAASHSLDVVDLDFSGGAKFRTLRVFIEKDAPTRAKLAAESAQSDESELPRDVPAEILSFVTHEDCEIFTRDFGTMLDVEDLIPEPTTPSKSRPRPRAQALETSRLHPLHRLARQASNLFRGR